MKKVKLTAVLMLVCLSFCISACKEKAQETEKEPEIVYTPFPMDENDHMIIPDRWQSSDGSIFFWITRDLKDKSNMTASYGLWCGSGSAFAKGACHYSDKDTKYLVLDPPDADSIDFSRCNGSDEDKQAMLDYMFQDDKPCIIKYDPSYKDLDKEGAYIYKDTTFFSSQYTKFLSQNSETLINNIPCIFIQENYTPKTVADVYINPDVSSTKLFLKRDNWNWYWFYTGDKKIKTLKSYPEGPWYHGFDFSTKGRTLEKATVNGVEDYWYCFTYQNRYAWVFGGDIEPWDTKKSQDGEYGDSIIASAVKDGFIELIDVDYSKYQGDFNYLNIGEEGESALYYNDDSIYFAFPYIHAFARYDRSCMAVDEDGFIKFTYGKGENDQLLFISGKQITQYFRNFKKDGKLTYEDEGSYYKGKYHDRYFKNISASSSFSETLGGRKITYSPQNLGRCFEVGCKCHPYWWNYSHIPWVEGADGNGIGESVTVEFTENMAGMSVLNGYTDMNKLKLFKENARLKEVIIEDLVNGDSWTVAFEDKVYFNYIEFPHETTKVKMTIKSVYEGTKYSDTCVSAIIPCKVPPKKNEDEAKKYQDRINKDFKNIIRNSEEVTPEELLTKISS